MRATGLLTMSHSIHLLHLAVVTFDWLGREKAEKMREKRLPLSYYLLIY